MNVLRILCIYLRLYHYFCCFWSKLSTAWWLAVDITAYHPFLCCRLRFALEQMGKELAGINERHNNSISMIFKAKMI